MKNSLYFIALLIFFSSAKGQNTDNNGNENQHKVEVFMNVSDALGRAVGNTSSSDFQTDPILFGTKLISKKNYAWRLGGNFRINSVNNLSNSFERITKENFYSVALGSEIRKEISEKLSYYYGLDVRYYSLNTTSRTVWWSQENTTISDLKHGPGLSPLLGFRWHITPRISLFTEASLTGQFLILNRTLEENGSKTTLEDKTEFTLYPVMPGAIFFIYNL